MELSGAHGVLSVRRSGTRRRTPLAPGSSRSEHVRVHRSVAKRPFGSSLRSDGTDEAPRGTPRRSRPSTLGGHVNTRKTLVSLAAHGDPRSRGRLRGSREGVRHHHRERRRRRVRHVRRGLRRHGRARQGRPGRGQAQRHRPAAGLGQLRRGHLDASRRSTTSRSAPTSPTPPPRTRSTRPTTSRAPTARPTSSTSASPSPSPTPTCSRPTRSRPGTTSPTSSRTPTAPGSTTTAATCRSATTPSVVPDVTSVADLLKPGVQGQGRAQR